MTAPCIVAIDPGALGAIAFLTDGGALLDVVDMPSIVVKVGGKNRTRVAEQGVALLLAANRPSHAFIELSGPRPTDGSQQSFGMGVAFGIVRGVVAALGVPMTLIAPAVWKRAMQVFPTRADEFKRVKDDGRAEAALLGLYGLRMQQREAA